MRRYVSDLFLATFALQTSPELTIDKHSDVEISLVLCVQRKASKLSDTVDVSGVGGEAALRTDRCRGDGAARLHCVLVQDDVIEKLVVRMEVSDSAHELVATAASIVDELATFDAVAKMLDSFLVVRDLRLN